MKKSNILEKTFSFVSKKNLICTGDNLLLAVSGGPDSVALLQILNSLKEKISFNIAVFHLDHQIRKNSYKDADFVQRLSEKLGLQFTGCKYDVTVFAKKQNLSLQEAARIIRYRLLEEHASKIKANKIATGHQANDQIETFFLRLLRGASLTGLQSIPVKRGNIIRPLLNTPRAELIDYLKQINQPFLTDPSNIKPVYLRNRIRNELIPVVENINSHYLSVMLKNIDLIEEDENLLDILTEELSNNVLSKEGNFTVINKESFLGLSVSLKRRLIRKAINLTKSNLREIESKHIELILESSADFGFTLELPADLLFYNDYKVLRFGSKKDFKPKKINDLQFKPGEKIKILPAGSILSAKKVNKCDSSGLVACLDYAKIKPPLTVRSRRTGDRFQPLGVKGTKKLQDFFVDSKVEKFLRDSVVIVEDQEKIIWVAGYQIDDRAKIDKNTKQILRLELN